MKTAPRHNDIRAAVSVMLVLALGGVLFVMVDVQRFSMNYGSGYAFKITSICLESWNYPSPYWDFSFVMKSTGGEQITSISVSFAGATLNGGLWDQDQYGYQTWNAWTGSLTPGQVVFGEWRTTSSGMILPGDYSPGDSYPLTITVTLSGGGASTYSGAALATDDPLSCPTYQT